MKVVRDIQKFEYGQVIVIVALSMFALVAMAALILDGGALMANRRAAQNAADAGALAGARALCNGQPDQIETQVTYYTETSNNAELVNWELDSTNPNEIDGLALGEVVVTARVEHESFFARIFGEDMLTAEATAAAGCFPYQPGIVLPIAYPCRKPLDGSTSENCDYTPLSWSKIIDVTDDVSYNPFSGIDPTDEQARYISDTLYLENYLKTMIVVDSDRVCGEKEEELDCSLWDDENPPDRYQINSSERGWLNLEAAPPSTNMLREWIANGVSDIKEHIWLSFYDGKKAAGYEALATRLDEIVWVPIFYGTCDEEPKIETEAGTITAECFDKAHIPDPPFGVDDDSQCTVNTRGNTSPTNLAAHVVSFVPFFPTCVQFNGNATFYPSNMKNDPDADCPGFVVALEENPDYIKDNSASMEGYFITDLVLPEGDDVHTGPVLGNLLKAVLTR